MGHVRDGDAFVIVFAHTSQQKTCPQGTAAESDTLSMHIEHWDSFGTCGTTIEETIFWMSFLSYNGCTGTAALSSKTMPDVI